MTPDLSWFHLHPWHAKEQSVVLATQSCPTLCDPTVCSPPGPSVHWISQARILESCHFLLRGIFPTQGLNLGLLLCRQILYCLGHQGSPKGTKGAGYTPSEACLLNRKPQPGPQPTKGKFCYRWNCMLHPQQLTLTAKNNPHWACPRPDAPMNCILLGPFQVPKEVLLLVSRNDPNSTPHNSYKPGKKCNTKLLYHLSP